MIDSSPSSAESSFRELDEAFLQTQTIIWLGEVLNIRLDEDLHISDLLQDGEILFEVSKVLWNLLLAKCMELTHLKHKYGPFGSKKSSGRYRPYSNVDSFLKICKILGLSGIDLFSPSDVVEKRNIRKVCICIRALSKIARSKQLSVPDFDVVIYSVTMPTDMVGVIRRSLESSQCTFSSSSSYSSRTISRTKLKRKNSHATSDRDDDYSSSDESDEAESRYMGENSFSSSCKLDYADGVNSDLENSPEANPISGQYKKQNILESDIKCQGTEEFKQGYSKSASLNEAVQPISPEYLENDHDHDKTPSRCIISQKKVHHGVSHVNNEDDDYSVVRDSSCTDIGESSYISDYLAFSDLMVHATDGSNPVIRDGGENNIFDFFLNVDSQGLNTGRRSFRSGSQRKLSDDEDMEVSSTTSMSSVLGRLLNLEFDDQFDEDDSSCAYVYSSASKESKAEKHYKDSFVLSEPPNMDTFQTLEVQSKMAPKVMTLLDSESDLLHNGDDHSHLEDAHVAYSIEDNISSVAENSNQDKREHDMDIQTESISDEKKDISPRLPPGKHGRRPLLKTVVKGTAIAGVLLLLLHIRKRNGNDERETKQYGRVPKHNGSRSASTKQQKRRVGRGIYPSEKLKLGN